MLSTVFKNLTEKKNNHLFLLSCLFYNYYCLEDKAGYLESVFIVYTFIASDTCICTTTQTVTPGRFILGKSTTKKIDIIVHNSPFLLMDTGTDLTQGTPKPAQHVFQQNISFIYQYYLFFSFFSKISQARKVRIKEINK